MKENKYYSISLYYEEYRKDSNYDDEAGIIEYKCSCGCHNAQNTKMRKYFKL